MSTFNRGTDLLLVSTMTSQEIYKNNLWNYFKDKYY